MRNTAAPLAIGVLMSSLLSAQTKPADTSLTYDVVSIKPNKSGESGGRWGRQPGGRWIMVNTATAVMIRSAYPTKADEIIGAPSWVMSERFDVEARATFEPTREQERMMLRTLLADRFKLAAHYETQDWPVYNLVVARADGRLGPQLRPVDVIDCAIAKPKNPTDPPICGVRMSGRSSTLTMTSGGLRMQSLADSPIASGAAGRPIIDKTGLSGFYAFTLEFSDGTDGVSIFTALQEQLGLKLEPARAPLDVVVIDHIERPTEN